MTQGDSDKHLPKDTTGGFYSRGLMHWWVFSLLPSCWLFFILLGNVERIPRAQAIKVQREVEEMKQEVGVLQDEAGRLKNDPFTVERMSRDSLGVAKPGEVIFKFQPYRTNTPTPGDAKRTVRGMEALRKP